MTNPDKTFYLMLAIYIYTRYTINFTLTEISISIFIEIIFQIFPKNFIRKMLFINGNTISICSDKIFWIYFRLFFRIHIDF